MATVRTITGAEYWASYFINGDASGLSEEEKAAADNWLALELEPGESVVDCEEEGRFTWSYDLHTHTETRGGNVIDYTVMKA
jgi:hypothetical protein